MASEKSFLWNPESLGSDVFIKMPEDPSSQAGKSPQRTPGPCPPSYASFGDTGTTVSVNAYGHIMQISRYLGVGLSGFFCVDLESYPRPYYVQSRMEKLMSSSRTSDEGIRLDFVDWKIFPNAPELGFMYDRWPRYVFNNNTPPKDKNKTEEKALGKSDGNSFSLSTQYFCSKNTVVQTYLLRDYNQKVSDRTVTLDQLPLAQDIAIRTVNFMDNNEYDTSWYGPELVKYVCATKNHLFVTRKIPVDILEKGRRGKMQPPKGKDGDPPAAVALRISPFINNQAAYIANIDDQYCITVDKEQRKLPYLEITIMYQLQLLSKDQLQVLDDIRPMDSASSEGEQVDNNDAKSEVDTEVDETLPLKSTHDALQKVEAAANSLTQAPMKRKEDTTLMENTGQPTEDGNNDRQSRKDTSCLADCFQSATQALKSMQKEFCENPEFSKIAFSQNRFLDFIFRRNLEHILSVCSIQVGDDIIAVTCGDISGHRVGPRASLSAVRFLYSVLTYLDKENSETRSRNRRACNIRSTTTSDDKNLSAVPDKQINDANTEVVDAEGKYTDLLKGRIQTVLKGHILWICDISNISECESPETSSSESELPKLSTSEDTAPDNMSSESSVSFSPHYWPTGISITNTDYLPAPSLIDTPMQLLKISPHLNFDGLENMDRPDRPELRGFLRAKVKAWLQKLHRLNNRGSYAFFEKLENLDDYFFLDEDYNSNPKYRLSDHAMIGMALHFIEKLNYEDGEIDYLCYYPYEEVRRKILKRFTVENPVSKQRTLATSRRTEETRFLFHSKDTFLFTATEEHFFNEPDRSTKTKELPKRSSNAVGPWQNFDDRWARLLEAQPYHNEYQQLVWNNPLWYALVYTLAAREFSVNQHPCNKLITITLSELFRLSRYNGLFPGLVGKDRMPAVYDDELNRDDYWFSTFEIPYVLWKSPQTNGENVTSTVVNSGGTKDRAIIGKQVRKHVPFSKLSNTKDHPGIVILLDDWLPNPPIVQGLELQLPKDAPDVDHVKRDTKDTHANPDQELGKAVINPSIQFTGIVIDVPKWSRAAEISREEVGHYDVSDLHDSRNAWESKKKIFWLSTRNGYKTVPNEMKFMNPFLKRHTKSQRYFFDNAIAASNHWETELHLSFYRITSSSKATKFVHELGRSKYLAITTMSIRFCGDFSDRFWTCYFLEDRTRKFVRDTKHLGMRLKPNEKTGILENLDLENEFSCPNPVERLEAMRTYRKPSKQWQQRNVLELLIYSKMLAALTKDTKELIRNIRALALRLNDDPVRIPLQEGIEEDDEDDEELDPFQKGIDEAKQLQRLANETDYLSIAAHWQDYKQILLEIEKNLTENIENIEQWQKRKSDRQDQQPRWSKQDQRLYGTTIAKLSVYTERQVIGIHRLRTQLSTFRSSLPNQLTDLREDINFRGSQNINLFTYVTVVFLPLGFVTGVLSMSGPPEHALLVNLVNLSLAALAITLVLLLHAKLFKAIISPILRIYLIFPQTMQKLFELAIYRAVVRPLIKYVVQHERFWKIANWFGWKPRLRTTDSQRAHEKSTSSSTNHHRYGTGKQHQDNQQQQVSGQGAVNTLQEPQKAEANVQMKSSHQGAPTAQKQPRTNTRDKSSANSQQKDNSTTAKNGMQQWKKKYERLKVFSMKRAVKDQISKEMREMGKTRKAEQPQTSEEAEKSTHNADKAGQKERSNEARSPYDSLCRLIPSFFGKRSGAGAEEQDLEAN